MTLKAQIERIKKYRTPFYYYDIDLFRNTLVNILDNSEKYGFNVHYAVKANSNARILKEISSFGIGADCVSGNEIKLALECGFEPQKIVFAGVGKTDEEILFALEAGIYCFNCESIEELIVINNIAKELNVVASIALRINPEIDALTHAHLSTGNNGHKFGLNLKEAEKAKSLLQLLENINFIGLHFHIGSQITKLSVFEQLCLKINSIIENKFSDFIIKYINVGGGLGVDYTNPLKNKIPQFDEYFNVFKNKLKYKSYQRVHFELGRSMVAQCGVLITKVIFVKGEIPYRIAIVDAGMNDLLRPALYGAKHFIENLTSIEEKEIYNVVGPVCESADCFGNNIELNKTNRGDLLVIYSCGAYGEVMSSRYNMRNIIGSVFSD